MPSSASSHGTRLCPYLLVGVVSLVVVGCTERNPSFDPDGGAPCVSGERQCDDQGLTIEICTEDATGFTDLRECYTASHCDDGVCVPDSAAEPCVKAADCTAAGDACSVLVDPAQPDRLGTWCLPSPNPAGRTGGQACSSHVQCQSGWCFRQVCFEACTEASDCTNNQHQCVRLNVTVDGVRDSYNIQGCVP